MKKGKLKRKLSQIAAIALAGVLTVQTGMPAFAANGQSESTASETEDVYTMETASDSDAELATGSDAMGGISLFSLRPLEEQDVYLVLNGYTEEELKAMPLETVLGKLVDYDGNPVEISEEANVVWSYYKDEDGEVIRDEYHVIGRGETVDLSPEYEWETEFRMELIVGSGKQLDPGNIRYNVTVSVSDVVEEYISYKLYKENSYGSRRRIDYDGIIKTESFILKDIGIPVTSVTYFTDEHVDDSTYYLSMDSEIAERTGRTGIQVDVYPMKKFVEKFTAGEELDGAITSQILNLYEYGEGYEGTYQNIADIQHPLEADNLFCIVYLDSITGEILGYQGILFTVCYGNASLIETLYSYENGEMKVLDQNINKSLNGVGWQLDLSKNLEDGVNRLETEYYSYGSSFYLPEGYTTDSDYYLSFHDNGLIDQVVIGNFYSKDEAVGAEDITEKILVSGDESAPYGYKANFSNRVRLTVFLEGGGIFRTSIYLNGDNSGKTVYDPTPVVNRADPYFRVTGAVGYDTFEVENDYDRTLDTLYGYGYQTIFINDSDADLSELVPIFWTPEDVRAHVGEEQISGESVQDFSNGPVYYAVHIQDNLKNYNVTFAKKEAGAKLFVNGPEKREIFLTEYFENRHDILIANLGDTELTGLKVELLDASNVKLDDYWVVGGENNESLGAFESVYESSMDNLAKVRLLPDGNGEVSGTLKISADGQEDVLIELTGYAGNPSIITKELSDAVKYVPYSYVVATDNMYDWNKVTFKLEGKLPKGLEFYPATGEIYGVPQETGKFPIKVTASYSRKEFVSSSAEFTLTVKENTNDNVYLSTDEGYMIEQHIGTETVAGSHDYYLNSTGDQLFVSAGVLGEFMGLWLNGQKLVDGVDYEKESGSTRITVRSQTFQNKAKDGSNTIAAEFRVDGDRNKELKRTAQNFRMNLPSSDDEDDDDNNDNSETNREEHSLGTVNSTVPTVQAPAGITDFTYTDESWIKDDIGWWVQNPDGTWLAGTWKLLPYRGTIEWYYFDERGYMLTGWFEDNGRKYYLHPISDGTQGRMYTGWQLIDGKWYYFNEISDGTKGALLTNTWIGEYFVDENGVWVE